MTTTALLTWIAIITISILCLWVIRSKGWGTGPGFSRGVVNAEKLKAELLGRGIEGGEAQLLLSMMKLAAVSNPDRLLNSRLGFEDALRRSLQADPELMKDLSMRKGLDRIRVRRGWEVPGNTSQGVSLPFEDEELLVGGQDGLQLRTTTIHRDAQSIAVRVIASSHPDQSELPWQVGDRLEVVFFRTDLGGLHFSTRLQEKRELGEWFLFLETPEKIQVEQRRQFARVSTDAKVRFLHLPMGRKQHQDPERELLQEASLIDIGTGGLAIRTEAVLECDDLLVMRGVPGVESRDITARVVALVPSGEDPEGGVGVRFVGLSAIDRDRIASLVFTARVDSADVGFHFDSSDPVEPALGTDGSASC